MVVYANCILRHFPLQLIQMTQHEVMFMYYVTLSFMVSTKGKMVHVLDLHNLAFINQSLSVSALTVCINF